MSRDDEAGAGSILLAFILGAVRPLVGHLNAIGRDAARAAQLATAQVERADRLFADVAQRFEQTLAAVDASISRPAREGRALLSAFRAAFQALREIRRDGRR